MSVRRKNKSVQPLGEVTQDKLVDYVSRASREAAYANHLGTKRKANRIVGIARAARKLSGVKHFADDDTNNGRSASRVPATKKRLDEVSSELLTRYIDKATKTWTKMPDRKKGDKRANYRNLALDKRSNLTKVGPSEMQKVMRPLKESKKTKIVRKQADEIEIEPEKNLINNRQG